MKSNSLLLVASPGSNKGGIQTSHARLSHEAGGHLLSGFSLVCFIYKRLGVVEHIQKRTLRLSSNQTSPCVALVTTLDADESSYRRYSRISR